MLVCLLFYFEQLSAHETGFAFPYYSLLPSQSKSTFLVAVKKEDVKKFRQKLLAAQKQQPTIKIIFDIENEFLVWYLVVRTSVRYKQDISKI